MIREKLKIIGPRWDFLALWALLAIAQLRCVLGNFFPTHDTLANLAFFVQFANNYFQTGQVMYWLPYGFGGLPANFYLSALMSPFQYLVVFLAKPMGVVNLPYLFYFSIFLEQSVFLFGIYLFARTFIKNNWALWLVCVGSICTIYWETQVEFNFRIYYLLPFVLYFFQRFFLSGKWENIWIACVFIITSLIGNVGYFAGFYLIFAVAAFISYYFIYGRPPTFKIGEIFERRANLILVGLLLLALCYLFSALHLFDYLVQYNPGRSGKDGRVSDLGTFLSYGDPSFSRYLEILWAIPHEIDLNSTIYIGLIPIFLIGSNLLKEWSREFKVIGVLVVVIFLLSLSFLTPLAPVMYLVPPIYFFRSLGFLATVNKFLMLLLAGVALERAFSDHRGAKRLSYWAFGVALFMGLLDIFVFRGPPYLPRAFNVSPMPVWDFHYFTILLVLGFAVLMLRFAKRSEQFLQAFVFCFFLFEILSFCSFLHFAGPAKRLGLPQDVFRSQPWVYQMQRAAGHRPSDAQAIVDLFSRRFGYMESIVEGSVQLDSCLRPFRRNLVSFGLDALLRARNKLPLTGDVPGYPIGLARDWPSSEPPPWSHAPFLPLSDKNLLHAAGCDAPKLLLTQNVTWKKNLGEVAEFVSTHKNIDQQTAVEVPTNDLLRSEQVSLSSSLNADVSIQEAHVKSFSANGLSIELPTLGNGVWWLLYREGYHPDWTAYVDEQERNIYRANIAFQAIPIRPGDKSVELVFTGGEFARWNNSLIVYGVLFALVILTLAIGFSFGSRRE